MKRICVFCGSNEGNAPEFVRAAQQLGERLSRHHLHLIYGGAKVGVMGALAGRVLQNGGAVTGIIPEALVRREVAHDGLADLRIVGSMHERKALMAELADGFVAMPGGLGTLEELFEIWTWAQLGHHRKPCGVLNVSGYFDGLLAFIDHAVAAGFIAPEHRHMLLVADSPDELLQRMADYAPPSVPEWLHAEQT